MTPPRRFLDVGLTALTFVFGWQALRSLLPLMAFLLRDRMGWDTLGLLALSVAVFSVSFLAPALARMLGRRRVLAISAGAVGLTRLALQLWTRDPLGELVLAAVATAGLLVFLGARLATARAEGPAGTAAFALGCLLGLALDSAIHGAYRTYDASWRSDGVSLVLMTVLVAVQMALLLRAQPVPAAAEVGGSAAFALALGPFLFLQSLVFQNVARLTVLTGWSPAAAFGTTLAGQALGVAAATRVLHRGLGPAGAVAVGLALVASQVVVWPRGTPAALLLVAGNAAAAAALATALLGMGGDGRTRSGRLAAAYGSGMLAMLLLVFLFYSGYERPLGIEPRALPAAAAAVVAMAAFAAGRRRPAAAAVHDGRYVVVVLLFLPLPLLQGLAARPAQVRAVELPVRVMTYNVHCGFDPRGHLGMEALARTIEAQDADVVALQEVSRGWAINGSIDMLAWLAGRLGMAHVFAPTADPLWGNAVLSRLPILGVETRALPPANLPLRRGLVAVRVDAGGEPLTVITTHLHHRRDPGASAIRAAQARAVVDFWDRRTRTVIAGDLNAEPGHPELDRLRAAGLVDAYERTGDPPGYTFHAMRPFKRIDYVWLSPDLTARDAVVAPEPASDHFGVAVTILGKDGA